MLSRRYPTETPLMNKKYFVSNCGVWNLNENSYSFDGS